LVGRLTKGPSIYDVHKKSRFDPPPACPHVSTWAGSPLPPCGRPHTVDMKYTRSLEMASTMTYTGPKAEIRLYDSNLFKLYF